MRYREFLLEYNRDLTAKQFGDKLIASLMRDQSFAMPANLALTNRRLRPIGLNGIQLLSQEQKDIIINDVLEYIEQKDPTPNKAYTPWLARMYAKGGGGFSIEDVNRGDLIGLYDIAKKRRKLQPAHTDINSFKWYSDFEDTMENIYNNFVDLELENMPEGTAKKVYEDSQVLVVVPLDEAAACKYGRGTRWCTASTRGDNYFNQYNRQGKLYILIPKNPERQGEKYQLHFPSNQYMDENDDPVSLGYVLQNRFHDQNLLKYFMEHEPEIKKLLEFTSNDNLDKAIHSLGDLVMDKVYEVITDWEHGDEYYYAWLKKQGYVDEEGDIDWDKVADNPEAEYMNYNPDAQEYLDKMQEILYMPAQKFKYAAQKLQEEGYYSVDEDIMLSDIDIVMSALISDRFEDRRRGSGDGGVSDYIDKNIVILRDGDTYKAELVKRKNS